MRTLPANKVAGSRIKASDSLRRFVKEKGGICVYCGVLVSLADTSNIIHNKPRNKATRDHIIPRVFGGKNAQENLVLACLKCNTTRGELPADLFALQVIKERAQ